MLRANGLGDYVVAQPALAALRAAYPDAVITLVTSPPVAALLDGRPSPVDEVLAAPRVAGVRGEPGPDGPPDDPPDVVEEFCAVLRARRFDLGIQLHGGGRNANPLLLRFGARITAGSRAPGAAPLDRTVPWTAFQHDLMRWLEVVSLVGVEPVCLRPRVAVTAPDRAEAVAALAGVGPRSARHRASRGHGPAPALAAPAARGARRRPGHARGTDRPARRVRRRAPRRRDPRGPRSGGRPSRRPVRPALRRRPRRGAGERGSVHRQRLGPAAPGGGGRHGHGGGVHAGRPRGRVPAVPCAAPGARLVAEPVRGVRGGPPRRTLRARGQCAGRHHGGRRAGACAGAARPPRSAAPRTSGRFARSSRRTAPSTRSSTASSSSTGSP